jgi:hypothetical protein
MPRPSARAKDYLDPIEVGRKLPYLCAVAFQPLIRRLALRAPNNAFCSTHRPAHRTVFAPGGKSNFRNEKTRVFGPNSEPSQILSKLLDAYPQNVLEVKRIVHNFEKLT